MVERSAETKGQRTTRRVQGRPAPVRQAKGLCPLQKRNAGVQ